MASGGEGSLGKPDWEVEVMGQEGCGHLPTQSLQPDAM